jgi:hypothetical protein
MHLRWTCPYINFKHEEIVAWGSVFACSHTVPVTIETHPATVTLSSLLELVAALMGCSDLPLDTQSNCGMMLVLLVIMLDNTKGEWFKVSFSSQVNSSTNFIEQSISWGANINSCSQEILGFLWDLKIHCFVHKRPLDLSWTRKTSPHPHILLLW